jgi:hypothetical protein
MLWKQKIIFGYLKETKYFGLWNPKGNDISLLDYRYAYWEGKIEGRISTSG